jgi:hypothetical protein
MSDIAHLVELRLIQTIDDLPRTWCVSGVRALHVCLLGQAQARVGAPPHGGGGCYAGGRCGDGETTERGEDWRVVRGAAQWVWVGV